MRLGERSCLFLNRLFPPRKRSERGTPQTYSEAEYRWAQGSLAMHGRHIRVADATILDAGCGLGGKTVFYADHGCRSIIGIDIDENHAKYAAEFARAKKAGSAHFMVGSLETLPFKQDEFDIIFLNDVVEHIRRPILVRALSECKRVIRKGGRICLEFPPWTSPDAGHLYEYISVPWCHLLFSAETLSSVVKRQDPKPRHGKLTVIEHFQELNHITTEEFRDIVDGLGFTIVNFEFLMIRRLGFLRYVPFFGKYLVSRVVAILSK